jgi:Tat protein translocase TatB subunit
MFGTLGGPELLLILVIALIVFGPRKLPEIGKSLGKMMAEFRKASTDFQRTIEEEVEADKMRQALDAPRTEIQPTPEPATPPIAAPETEDPSGVPSPDGTVRHVSSVPEAEHQ